MIIGSMTFAKEMRTTKGELENLGHTVSLPVDVELHIENETLADDLEADYKHVTENDILRKCFKLVSESEAVLVLNHPKNDTEGYIGTSALMEVGIAYHLGKNIFLLNEVPSFDNCRWAHEIAMIQPTVISGDLNKIK